MLVARSTGFMRGRYALSRSHDPCIRVLMRQVLSEILVCRLMFSAHSERRRSSAPQNTSLDFRKAMRRCEPRFLNASINPVTCYGQIRWPEAGARMMVGRCIPSFSPACVICIESTSDCRGPLAASRRTIAIPATLEAPASRACNKTVPLRAFVGRRPHFHSSQHGLTAAEAIR